MFCPDGYVSLAEIIRTVHSESCFREPARKLIESMLERDSMKGLTAWIVKMHPMHDIVETIVFEEAYRAGIYVCSPEGKTLRLHMPFHEVSYTIHELVRHFEAMDEYEHLLSFIGDSDDFHVLKSHNDQLKYVDQKYLDDTLDDLENKRYNSSMANIWLHSYCRINLHFNRSNYTVSTMILDRLEATGCWTPARRGLGDDGQALRPMNGYSLCVRTKDCQSLSVAAIHRKFGEAMYSHMVGDDVSSADRGSEAPDDVTKSKGGRPNKSDQAAQLVLEHYGGETFSSLKEAVRFLEAEHDIRVHQRTLQRGIKRILDDKS
jgi:hypothetical protein